MPLDDKDVVILKLQTALGQAPRPKPKADAEWVVMYMDWFFQTRIAALEEATAKKEHWTTEMARAAGHD